MHAAYLHGAMEWVVCLKFCLTVSNPASPLVHEQECCEHCPPLSTCADWKLPPSCPGLTVWLQFDLCYAVLAEFLLSLAHTGQFVVLHLSASPSSLCSGAVSRRRGSSTCSHLCLSVYFFVLRVCLEPVEPWRCTLLKTAWVFLSVHTNPSSVSLINSLFTGSSIQVTLALGEAASLLRPNIYYDNSKSCKVHKKFPSCLPIFRKLMLWWRW